MSIAQLGGHKFTARAKDPSLQFDLNTNPGDANIKSVTVTLPKAFHIAQEHLGNLCSKGQLEREHCAGRQPIGSVIDETPLLEKPLEGPPTRSRATAAAATSCPTSSSSSAAR